jgi:hypothetical protein
MTAIVNEAGTMVLVVVLVTRDVVGLDQLADTVLLWRPRRGTART